MTKLVGILNLTPDSFSDGDKYNGIDKIKSHVQKLIADGANIIDIGAESTRPGAKPLSHTEEWTRLEESLHWIIETAHINSQLVSIDTRHSETALKAINIGIDWVNDVDGFNNPNMLKAVKNSNVKLVCMHSLSVPAEKNNLIPKDYDVVAEIMKWAEEKINILEKHGIEKSRIMFDPGIGFGKNTKQSWDIIERATEFKKLGVPLFIGHSRKSFLGTDTNKDAATIKVSQDLIAKDIDYIRVHDVKGHLQALKGLCM